MAEGQDPTSAPSGNPKRCPLPANDNVLLDFPFVISVQTEGKLRSECVPDIAALVFGHFDTQTLLCGRAVSQSWKEYIDTQTQLWSKMSLMKAVRDGRMDIVQLIVENSEDKNPADAVSEKLEG